MKDKDLCLDILENADDAEIRRIADSCPASESDRERMFAMSRKIYNERTKESKEAPVIEVSGVEIYKRPLWHKIVSAAAVIALIAGSVTGSWAMLHKGRFLVARVDNESTLPPVTENDSNDNEHEERSGKDSPLVNSDYAIDDHVKVYNPILDKEEDILVSHCNVRLETFNKESDDRYKLLCCNAAKLSKLYKDFDWEETSDEERYSHTSYNFIECSYILGEEYTESTPNLGVLFYDYGLIDVFYKPDAQSEPIHKCYDIGKENIEKVFDYVLAEYDLVKSNINPDKLLKLLNYSFIEVNKSYVDYSNTFKLGYIDAQKLEKAMLSAEWTEWDNSDGNTYDEDDGNISPAYTMMFINKFTDDGCQMALYNHNLLKLDFNDIEIIYKISDELNDTIKNIIDNASGSSASFNSAETVAVPPVAGIHIDLAKSMLKESGLEVNVVKKEDTIEQPSFVIKSEPPEGKEVPKGSRVTLFVSSSDSHQSDNDMPTGGFSFSIPENINGRYSVDAVITTFDGNTAIQPCGEFSCPETKNFTINIDEKYNNSNIKVYLTNIDTFKRAFAFSVIYEENEDMTGVVFDDNISDIADVFRSVQ